MQKYDNRKTQSEDVFLLSSLRCACFLYAVRFGAFVAIFFHFYHLSLII